MTPGDIVRMDSEDFPWAGILVVAIVTEGRVVAWDEEFGLFEFRAIPNPEDVLDWSAWGEVSSDYFIGYDMTWDNGQCRLSTTGERTEEPIISNIGELERKGEFPIPKYMLTAHERSVRLEVNLFLAGGAQ